MKNTLTINADQNFIVDCLDSVNDGTNSLYLHFITSANVAVTYADHGSQTITPDNDTVEIDQSWYLSNDLTFTVGDVTYTVLHPTTTTGEMMVQLVEGNTYQITFKITGGGGGGITVDSELSETSTNPVENRAITARLNEVFQSVSNGKTLIAAAITDKGVDTAATDTFQTMATNIESIQSGGVIQLTKEQYDSLPDEEKQNGSVYYVEERADGDPGIISLLHFDESTIQDDAGKKWINSSDKILLSSTYKKFGKSSLSLNVAGEISHVNEYLLSEASLDFDFSNNDFTIDAWININNISTRYALFAISNVRQNADFRMGIDLIYNGGSANQWLSSNGSSWNIISSDGSGAGKGTISLTANEWHHIALVRNSEYLTTFIDGQIARRNNIGTAGMYYDIQNMIKIGTWGNNRYFYSGYIDEFCIRNYAAWTDEFTPPTEPYEAYKKTSHLYYMGIDFELAA